VTIAYDDDPDDTDTFLLGSRELMALADSTDIEVFSPQSPLGAAITGAKVGDTVTYTAPNGNPIEVTVLAVEAYKG
jgi:transcription elongation factor GreA